MAVQWRGTGSAWSSTVQDAVEEEEEVSVVVVVKWEENDNDNKMSYGVMHVPADWFTGEVMMHALV